MDRKRPIALLVIAGLLWVGCSLRSAVYPGVAKHDWFELKSSHFVLTTDLPRDKAVERLEELEQLWQALAELYVIVVPGKSPPPMMMRVVHLRSQDDFKLVIWRQGIGGFVDSTMDFEQERLVVTCEQLPGRTEILLHELAHNFNHVYLAHAPAWLNEGLATYFQTITVDSGQAVVGRPSAMDRPYYFNSSLHLPSLTALLAMEYDEFYAGHAGDRRHYFAAWKLVHLLSTSSEEYHDRFQRYLSLLGAGRTTADAWTEAFRGIASEKLSADYEGNQRHHRIRLWKVPFRRPQIPSHPVVRVLRPGEVHAQWAHLQMIRARAARKNLPDLEAVRAHLEFAMRDDANWSGVTFWRAAFEYYFGEKVEGPGHALTLLRKYLEEEPRDARARLGVVLVRMREAVPEEYAGLGREPRGLAQFEGDVMELVRVSQTAAELQLIARYFALRKNSATGLGFARRSLAVDPGCAECVDTLALLLFHAGKPKEARAAQERAMSMMDEDEVPEALRKRLRAYRKAAREASDLQPGRASP